MSSILVVVGAGMGFRLGIALLRHRTGGLRRCAVRAGQIGVPRRKPSTDLARRLGLDPDVEALVRSIARLGMALVLAVCLVVGRYARFPAVVAGCLGVAACVLLPRLALRRSLASAMARLRADSADVVAMLADARASGAAMGDTLGHAAAASRGPMRALLQRCGRRVAAGQPAARALHIEARAVSASDLAAAAALLEEAGRTGLPVAPGLYALGEEIRSRRQATLLAQAGRAVPTSALITALVIAPGAVVVLMVGLLGSAILRGGALVGVH